MPGINDYLSQIRQAVYGREVRDAIANGIEQCYTDTNTGATAAGDAATQAATDVAALIQNANSTISDRITHLNTIFNGLENELDAKEDEFEASVNTAVGAANTATSSANTAAQNANAAATALSNNAQDIVLVQQNEPQNKPYNKVWAKPTVEEYVVPTYDEFSDLKSAFSDFDDGKKSVDIEMDWTQGFINNDGSIDTSVSTYYITRKISAVEINGGIITSNPNYSLYVYKYRADGTYVSPYVNLGKISTYNVPSDFVGNNIDVIFEMKAEGYSGVSAKGYEVTNTQTQINTLTAQSSDVPKVVMVDKLVALENEQFDIHYDNIFVNYRANDITYKELFGNVSGVGMDNMARLQSDVVGSGVTGSIRYRKYIPDAFNSPALPDNVLKKAFSVDTIATTSGSGTNRKVLLIGDSWTAPGKYARELRNLFDSADEPMDITLLGTLGNGGAYVGPENGYHEGHGAYSAKTYCTQATYNSYTNGFYNPTSQTFDFEYYMTQCGYTSVDDVFINLGINDVAETADFDEIIGYWEIITNSIMAYATSTNHDIKIFIGLCGLPAQYKYGVLNNNCNREKARRLMLHEKLIESYGNRENEGYIIVPLHLSIDSEHDFPTEQRARSYRDSTLVDYCTDYVHPTDIAYNKIADRIRTYIKYAETLS